jgi:serine/threonine protein kinase
VQALDRTDPKTIGDYVLLGRLGRGGMGTVYLGRSRGGRPVAVKLVREAVAEQAEFRERFRREVEMARVVGGFWTAAVVDADPEAELPWLATEYVAGPSLHQAVTEHGRLPERSVLRLAAGLAEALEAIHKAGLVHRDLKPSNVLLATDGPRVIDFGIARASGRSTLTATGMFMGTPGFFSPEQITGDAPIGPSSDVFSLGAVLVFAATATGPFGDGDTSTLISRATHSEPDLHDVPDGLRGPIAACLRRDPAQRPTPTELLISIGGGEAVRPARTAWLPKPVATLVERHHTELNNNIRPTRSIVAGARERGTAPDPAIPPKTDAGQRNSRASHTPSVQPDIPSRPPVPPQSAAAPAKPKQRSSRVASLLWGCLSLATAALAAHTASHPAGIGRLGHVIGLIGFLVCLIAGIGLLIRAARS